MNNHYQKLVTLLVEQEDDPMQDLEKRKSSLETMIKGLPETTPKELRQKEALRRDLERVERLIKNQKDLRKGKGVGELTRLKSAVVGGGTTYLGIIQNFLKSALGTGKKRISSSVLAT